MTPECVVKAAVTPRKDTCWKVQDGRGTRWMVKTTRSPRETRLEPSAVYYPRHGPRLFQYVLTRRPVDASEVL